MTVENMRKKLMFGSAYEGPNWQYRVKNMSDNQVTAIYYKLKDRGMLKKRKTKITNDDYHQITIFEYLEGIDEKV